MYTDAGAYKLLESPISSGMRIADRADNPADPARNQEVRTGGSAGGALAARFQCDVRRSVLRLRPDARKRCLFRVRGPANACYAFADNVSVLACDDASDDRVLARQPCIH